MEIQYLLFIAPLLIVVSAKFDIRTQEDAVKAHEECQDLYNLPPDIYEQFINYQFPEHRHTNCYVKCWIEKMGLFTDLKGFDEKNIISQFSHDNTKNLESVRHGLEKCIDHNEWDTDNCTWANRVFSCWLKINRHIVRKAFVAPK